MCQLDRSLSNRMAVHAYLSRDKGIQNRHGMCHRILTCLRQVHVRILQRIMHLAMFSYTTYVINKHINAYKIKLALCNMHNHGNNKSDFSICIA
jgi:hypothetical protein